MQGPDVQPGFGQVPVPARRRVSINTLPREQGVVIDGIFLFQLRDSWADNSIEIDLSSEVSQDKKNIEPIVIPVAAHSNILLYQCESLTRCSQSSSRECSRHLNGHDQSHRAKGS